jgi:hypothetical protein
MVTEARKHLARLSTGAPVRDANATAPANLAASASAPYVDSRGWSRYGGIG